jgi:hypothetical protein
VKLAESKDLPIHTAPEKLPMYLPANYWLDLQKYNQVETAKAYNGGILVLNAERDFQVGPEDYGIWEKNLKGKTDVTFKSYPKLNHLFIAGESKSTPAEYQNGVGNIPEAVVNDIAEWAKGTHKVNAGK